MTAGTVTYEAAANRLHWTGTLPAGVEWYLYAFYTIPCLPEGTDLGYIRASGTIGTNPATATLGPLIIFWPDFSESTKSGPTGALVGDEIPYEIVLRNTSDIEAQVWVTDAIPAGTTYVSGSAWASAGEVNYSTSGITWSDYIMYDETVTIRFRVRAAQAGVVTNRLRIDEGLGVCREPYTRTLTTNVGVPSTATPTPTRTATVTPTATPTRTATATATGTLTPPGTATATGTPTETGTGSAAGTPTPTDTPTATVTATNPPVSTPTPTGPANPPGASLPPSWGTFHWVWWGPRRYISTDAVYSSPGPITLAVEACADGPNMPGSLRVWEEVDFQEALLGTVTWTGITEPGPLFSLFPVTYRGTVTVRPWKPLGCNEVEPHLLYIEDPFRPGWKRYLILVVFRLIDPSGYVYDAATTARITGAVVTLYQRQGSQWVPWNAAPFKQGNPQITGLSGHYGWDVPEGDYQVRVSDACYADAQSESMHIPPPRTDVNIGMTRAACARVSVAQVWTADWAGVPEVWFRGGDGMQLRIVLGNSSGSAAAVNLSWSILDPTGNRLTLLSGNRQEMIPDGGSEVMLPLLLPLNAERGSYTVLANLTYQGQTSVAGASFLLTDRSTVYVPLLLMEKADRG